MPAGHSNQGGWPRLLRFRTDRNPNLARERVYIAIQCAQAAGGIEFDWDDQNRKRLAARKASPAEFEEVTNNGPINVAFDRIDGEERYCSVGLANSGRLLPAVRRIRNGKARAITAFPAGVSGRKAFLEKPK